MASATLEYNGAQVTNSLNSQRARFEQFAGVSSRPATPAQKRCCAKQCPEHTRRMQNTRAFADSIAEMAEALLGIEGEEQAGFRFSAIFLSSVFAQSY